MKIQRFQTVYFILFNSLKYGFLITNFIVLMNSFKGKFHISRVPFKFPDSTTFVKFENYLAGIEKTGFSQLLSIHCL